MKKLSCNCGYRIVENAYRNTKTRYYDSTFGNELSQCPKCGKDIHKLMQYRKNRIRDARREYENH